MLLQGVYEDAFPLHDGDYDYGDEEKNNQFMNHRRVRDMIISLNYGKRGI